MKCQPRLLNLGAFSGRDCLLGPILLSPMLILLLGLIAYPFGLAVYLSMTDKMIGRQPHFIGFGNYTELFTDPIFRRTVMNTLQYTLLAVALKLSIGLGMALALNRVTRGKNLLSGLLLIPWIIPGVVVAVAWLWMLDPLNGIVNYILLNTGLSRQAPGWLGDFRLALISVILVNVWRGFPFFGITVLAGLKTIPTVLYEAADVDGAGLWKQFRHVTLPGLVTVCPILLLLSLIWTFNDFVTIFVLTRGGPAGATHIIGTLTYEIGIGAMQIGKGIAVSLYAAPVLVLLIAFFTRSMLKKEVL